MSGSAPPDTEPAAPGAVCRPPRGSLTQSGRSQAAPSSGGEAKKPARRPHLLQRRAQEAEGARQGQNTTGSDGTSKTDLMAELKSRNDELEQAQRQLLKSVGELQQKQDVTEEKSKSTASRKGQNWRQRHQEVGETKADVYYLENQLQQSEQAAEREKKRAACLEAELAELKSLQGLSVDEKVASLEAKCRALEEKRAAEAEALKQTVAELEELQLATRVGAADASTGEERAAWAKEKAILESKCTALEAELRQVKTAANAAQAELQAKCIALEQKLEEAELSSLEVSLAEAVETLAILESKCAALEAELGQVKTAASAAQAELQAKCIALEQKLEEAQAGSPLTKQELVDQLQKRNEELERAQMGQLKSGSADADTVRLQAEVEELRSRLEAEDAGSPRSKQELVRQLEERNKELGEMQMQVLHSKEQSDRELASKDKALESVKGEHWRQRLQERSEQDAEFKSIDAMLREVEDERDSLAKELAGVKAELQQSASKAARLEQELEEAQAGSPLTKQELVDQLQKRNEELGRAQMGQLEGGETAADTVRLQAEVEKLRSRLEAEDAGSPRSKQELVRELAERNKELGEAQMGLLSTGDSLKQRLAELEQELKVKSDLAGELKQRVAGLEQKLEEAEAGSPLTKQELVDQLQQLNEELGRAQMGQLKSGEADTVRLQAEVEELRSRLEAEDAGSPRSKQELIEELKSRNEELSRAQMQMLHSKQESGQEHERAVAATKKELQARNKALEEAQMQLLQRKKASQRDQEEQLLEMSNITKQAELDKVSMKGGQWRQQLQERAGKEAELNSLEVSLTEAEERGERLELQLSDLQAKVSDEEAFPMSKKELVEQLQAKDLELEQMQMQLLLSKENSEREHEETKGQLQARNKALEEAQMKMLHSKSDSRREREELLESSKKELMEQLQARNKALAEAQMQVLQSKSDSRQADHILEMSNKLADLDMVNMRGGQWRQRLQERSSQEAEANNLDALLRDVEDERDSLAKELAFVKAEADEMRTELAREVGDVGSPLTKKQLVEQLQARNKALEEAQMKMLHNKSDSRRDHQETLEASKKELQARNKALAEAQMQVLQSKSDSRQADHILEMSNKLAELDMVNMRGGQWRQRLQERSSKEAEVNSLELMLTEAEQKGERLEIQLAEMQAVADEMRTELAREVGDVGSPLTKKQLIEQLQVRNRALEEAQMELLSNKSSSRHQQAQAEEVQTELELAESKVAELEEQLSESRAGSPLSKRELVAELLSRNKALEEAQMQLLKSKSDSRKNAKESGLQMVNKRGEQWRQRHQEVGDREAQLVYLEKLLDESEDQRSELEGELDRLRAEAEDMREVQSEVAELEQQLDESRAELDESRAGSPLTKRELVAELLSRNKALEEAQMQLLKSKSDSRKNAKESGLQMVNKRGEQWRQKRQAQQDVGDMEAQLGYLEKLLDESEDKRSELEGELDRLQAEAASMSKSDAQTENPKKPKKKPLKPKKSKKVVELEQLLAEAEDKGTCLEDQLREQAATAKQGVDKVAELEEQLDESRAELDESRAGSPLTKRELVAELLSRNKELEEAQLQLLKTKSVSRQQDEASRQQQEELTKDSALQKVNMRGERWRQRHQEVGDMEAQLKYLEKLLDESEDKRSELEGELDRLQAEAASMSKSDAQTENPKKPKKKPLKPKKSKKVVELEQRRQIQQEVVDMVARLMYVEQLLDESEEKRSKLEDIVRDQAAKLKLSLDEMAVLEQQLDQLHSGPTLSKKDLVEQLQERNEDSKDAQLQLTRRVNLQDSEQEQAVGDMVAQLMYLETLLTKAEEKGDRLTQELQLSKSKVAQLEQLDESHSATTMSADEVARQKALAIYHTPNPHDARKAKKAKAVKDAAATKEHDKDSALLKEAEARAARLEVELSQAKSQLAAQTYVDAEGMTLEDRCTAEAETLKQGMLDLTEQLREFRSSSSDNAMVARFEAEGLRQKVAQLERELAAQCNEHNTLYDANQNNTVGNAGEAKLRISTLEEQLAVAQSEYEEAEKHGADQTRAEIERLHRELDIAKQQHASMQAAAEEADVREANVLGEALVCSERVIELERQLSEVEALRAEIERLHRELDIAKQQHASMQAAAEEADVREANVLGEALVCSERVIELERQLSEVEALHDEKERQLLAKSSQDDEKAVDTKLKSTETKGVDTELKGVDRQLIQAAELQEQLSTELREAKTNLNELTKERNRSAQVLKVAQGLAFKYWSALQMMRCVSTWQMQLLKGNTSRADNARVVNRQIAARAESTRLEELTAKLRSTERTLHDLEDKHMLELAAARRLAKQAADERVASERIKSAEAVRTAADAGEERAADEFLIAAEQQQRKLEYAQERGAFQERRTRLQHRRLGLRVLRSTFEHLQALKLFKCLSDWQLNLHTIGKLSIQRDGQSAASSVNFSEIFSESQSPPNPSTPSAQRPPALPSLSASSPTGPLLKVTRDLEHQMSSLKDQVAAKQSELVPAHQRVQIWEQTMELVQSLLKSAAVPSSYAKLPELVHQAAAETGVPPESPAVAAIVKQAGLLAQFFSRIGIAEHVKGWSPVVVSPLAVVDPLEARLAKLESQVSQERTAKEKALAQIAMENKYFGQLRNVYEHSFADVVSRHTVPSKDAD